MNMQSTGYTLRMTVYTALLTALIVIGAYVIIPIGPVPIALQSLFILLAGLLLGPTWGLACIGLYTTFGILGLPVFSGGGAGIGHILGPTGGYIIGFIPAVFILGIVSGRKRMLLRDIAAVIAGSLIIYAAGIPWLKYVLNLTWDKAVAAGMLPFLPGDAAKAGIAVLVARYAGPLMPKESRNRQQQTADE